MSTLNDLHGKVPPPPVRVVPLGSSVWDVQTINKPYIRLATCRDRNVADYIAALWNLMPAVEPEPQLPPTGGELLEAARDKYRRLKEEGVDITKPVVKYRRRKAGKSVQVMP